MNGVAICAEQELEEGGGCPDTPPPRNMKSYLIKMLILFIKHGNCGPGLDKYVY